jgi:short-subunit dehydrogenase
MKLIVVWISYVCLCIEEALAHSFFDAGCKLILVSRRREDLERVKNDLIRKKAVCDVIQYELLFHSISHTS